MSVLTVALSGVGTSTLEAKFFPEIPLDDDAYEYSCALLDLSIKNGSETNKLIESGINRINCDIISGSYINGVHCNTIHQFASSALKVKHQTIVEIPIHLNYFPVKVKSLRSIHISILDNKGKPVNIQGEVCCRINIKREIRA